jgi:DNA-binding NarL/FixJ family response regulator
MQTIHIALADDHILFRDGLAELIRSFGQYAVTLECDNGNELIAALKPEQLPDLVLLDINMPEKDGYDTAKWLKEHYPSIKTIALSMYDNENAILRMVRNGVRGYILKDVRKQELKQALHSVVTQGFYYTHTITGKLINSIHHQQDDNKEKATAVSAINLNDREIDFLKLASTELTYKQIADKMSLSVHTIDGYRESLFEKLQAKSRVGLVLYAVKNNIVAV